jgi:predicted permease
MPEHEARREAVREFGDVELTRRYCMEMDAGQERDERRTEVLAELASDARYAVRGFRRSPGAAIVATLTLALGIGANTAIFSVVKGALLDPLPYREPERIVRVYGALSKEKLDRVQIAAADMMDFVARQRTFVSLSPFRTGGYTYTGVGEPEQMTGVRVSADMFRTLGVTPALGRLFVDGDDKPGAQPIVVLSDRIWRRRFGGDSTLIGKTIQLSGSGRTVVGVLRPGFEMPMEDPVDLYTPLDLTPLLQDVNRARAFHVLYALGRLKPGVTPADARRDLDAIARDLARQFPKSNEGITANVVPARDALVGAAGPALRVLMGAAILVLLIACANVAGLLLSRTIARRQELGIRTGLGAGRGRLVRQLVTESFVLAAAGAALGLLLALGGTRLLAVIGQGAVPKSVTATIDLGVLAFTFASALGSVVLFGVAPAIIGARGAGHVLRDAGRASTAGSARQRLRSTLVAGQIALAVVLLIGAGLLVRTLIQLQRSNLGYSTTGLVSFTIGLPGARYSDGAKQDQFFAALLERMRAIPGVVSAGTIGTVPLNGGASASLAIDGRPAPADGRLPEVGYVPTSDTYFETMRIPLVRGRPFDARDTDKSPPVVLLSESVAKRFWPNGDAIGARVRLGPNPSDPWSEVVGIVGDVRRAPDADIVPTAYVSDKQDHWGSASVVLRVTGSPTPYLARIPREVQAIDPLLPVIDAAPMQELFRRRVANRRLPMQLMSGFAALALLLAAIGVYGVMAFSVAARTREFGIRMALGARRERVLAMVLRQGIGSAIAGLAIGTIGAFWLMRLLAKLLYGVRPADPLTFALVAIVMLTVTLAAALIPARRATRVDPVVALRNE